MAEVVEFVCKEDARLFLRRPSHPESRDPDFSGPVMDNPEHVELAGLVCYQNGRRCVFRREDIPALKGASSLGGISRLTVGTGPPFGCNISTVHDVLRELAPGEGGWLPVTHT